MAEETQKPEASSAPAAAAPERPSTEEVMVEKPVDEKEPPPAPEPVAEAPEKPAPTEEQATVETVGAEKPKAVEVVGITQSVSYKEETTIASELPEAQKKALDELKQLVQEAINKNEFTLPPPPAPAKEEEKPSESEPAKTEEKVEEKPSESEPAKTEEKVEEKPSESEPAKTEEKVEEKTEEKVEEKTEKKVEEKVEVKEEEEKPAASSTAQESKSIGAEPEQPTPPPEEKIEVKEEKVEVQREETKVEAAVEKATAVDEDGAKTVEAIEETVVAASSAPATAAEPEETKTEETPAPPPPPPPEEVLIWGIPLLADERSDVILLKFLRARDFKVKDAFAMIKNTVRWRKEFRIEAMLEEDFGSDFDKIVYMHGFDKEGHPVCYNAFSAFQDKELYQKCFGNEEKRVKFLRWRIQFLERSIRKLDFNPGGISTIVQVNDLKDSPWLGRKEFRQALDLFQDNYPEFVARQVFINVPWWYLAFIRIISPFLTQRTKSKFVFAGPAKSAETLFKYIAPEQVPIHFGGLSKEGEQEFTVSDSVTEVTVKLTTKHTVEIPVSESCLLVWEIRAVGWDVGYGAEFVPDAEGGYTVIVSKSRKVTPSDDPVISDTFKICEPGKIVLTIDNPTSKKKKLLYRFKTKPVSK